MTRFALIPAALLLASGLGGAEDPTPTRPDLEVTLSVEPPMTLMTLEPPRFYVLKVAFSGDVEGGAGEGLHPGLPSLAEHLSPSEHAELAALLEKEQFFSMVGGLGCVYDGGGRVIHAWRGTEQHSVCFIVEAPDVPLPRIQSALRVWYGVLSLVAGGKRIPVTDADRRILAR